VLLSRVRFMNFLQRTRRNEEKLPNSQKSLQRKSQENFYVSNFRDIAIKHLNDMSCLIWS